jgi:hypothetical protein
LEFRSKPGGNTDEQGKRQALIILNKCIKKTCKKDHSRDFVLPHETELSTRESEKQDRMDILQEEKEHTKDNI